MRFSDAITELINARVRGYPFPERRHAGANIGKNVAHRREKH